VQVAFTVPSESTLALGEYDLCSLQTTVKLAAMARSVERVRHAGVASRARR
jgi:hypothetical protein